MSVVFFHSAYDLGENGSSFSQEVSAMIWPLGFEEDLIISVKHLVPPGSYESM
jgi:hypothetical protein